VKSGEEQFKHNGYDHNHYFPEISELVEIPIESPSQNESPPPDKILGTIATVTVREISELVYKCQLNRHLKMNLLRLTK